ncbi:glycine zipper 2TM domain-containing protein [Novosphingobium sp.]|uniref:glycine zipper 2TM domain-containing protein n=1 Tax=Novosphingobium sp. TaxID=1874826 RepID=UPI0025F09470|nr:glycine zipper 2TM domain-containing protein [Novosphingobium sp.]MCC6927146.1 glycine zipper 2TM domain-containing protein [Novosphingobium sp.]
MKSRRLEVSLVSALSIAFAAPAMAQSAPPPPGAVDAAGNYYGNATPDQRPDWPGGPAAAPQPGYDRAAYDQARADWLAECRRNRGSGKTVGGAVLGGLVGGVIGNQVAGRGNRTVGTVVGAAAGAVAGGAIGNAADKRAQRDYCEAYLDRYTSHQGYGTYGYGQQVTWGYAPMTVMVPVAMMPVAAAPQQQRECKETVVTEEWVPVPSRPRIRYIPPRRTPDKRVRVVPDKRVRVN